MTRFLKDRLEITNLDACSNDWRQHFDDFFILFVSLVVLFLNESLKSLKISLIILVKLGRNERVLDLLREILVDLIESFLNLADKGPDYSQSCIYVLLHNLFKVHLSLAVFMDLIHHLLGLLLLNLPQLLIFLDQSFFNLTQSRIKLVEEGLLNLLDVFCRLSLVVIVACIVSLVSWC
jgi:hypothetical protein